jgi:hypothetical protein
MHHTRYFELSQRWEWLASTPVLALLAVVAIAEIAADRVPESAELVELASWLPKAIVGFAGVAATVGTVDSNVVSLVGSGLLGAGVAVTTDRLRVAARAKTRELADAGAGGADRAAHHVESLAAAGVTAAAVLQPWLVVILIVGAIGLGVVAFFISRGLSSAAVRMTGLRTGDEAGETE